MCRDGCRPVGLAQGTGQIHGETADLLDLFVRSRLFEAFADENGLRAAPDQGREAALSHQARRADVAKRIFRGFRAAFDESHESVALEDEVRGDFGGDDLNTCRGQLLDDSGHIL